MAMEHGSPARGARNAWDGAIRPEVALRGLKHPERDARLAPFVYTDSRPVEKLGVEPHVRLTVKGDNRHRKESTSKRKMELGISLAP